ncbi:MAG: GxxExxY protein [Candidatus Kapaibacterium sp.]|nr:MAG: GxxExxY protein [Candidatus Kapabacteria bacterium]
MSNEQYQHSELTEKIIGAFYTVYNALGYGFLEKCYESAMVIELEKLGLSVEAQRPITVYYDGRVIGEYKADIAVENSVILELKAARELAPEHKAQLLNYLRATPIEVGLLLNFGIRAEVQRLTFNNERKSHLPK